MADNKLSGKNRKESFAPHQIFALICLIEEGRFSVSGVLQEFGIFRPTFYKWRKRSTAYQSGRESFGGSLLGKEDWGQNFSQRMFDVVGSARVKIAGKTPLYFSKVSLKSITPPLLCNPIAFQVKHPPGSYSLEGK